MKYAFSLLILVSVGIGFISCDVSQNVVSEMPPPPPAPDPTPEMVEQAEAVEEESAIEVILEGPRTVVGSFRSVRGVMDPLSCYCSNGGYVESPAGESVAVCFNDNISISSTDFIKVTGIMTNRTIESNGACPSGTMTYLVVETYSLQPE